MKHFILVFFGVCIPFFLSAQTDSITKKVEFSGYAEVYFTWDSGEPDDHNRPGFMWSHSRANEVNLNLAYLKAAYTDKKARANLGLMAGTYPMANLAGEPVMLRFIYEANVGVKLSKSKNIWLDAGILPSHIGFESAQSSLCWNVTRSILADNSPYFETGVKLTSISSNEKWTLSALVLNGWQRILRANGTILPSFGHQIQYKPNAKILLNSSSFIGNDKPDSVRQMRFFHNFYGQFQCTKKFGLIAGFDIGAEQAYPSATTYNLWYAPVLIARFTPSEKIAVAVRGEYYSDEEGVIIYTNTPHGFQTTNASLNLDYYVMENVMIRAEGRFWNSRDEIFMLNGDPSRTNYAVTLSVSAGF